MRYIVKLHINKTIVNYLTTDDYSLALKKEIELRNKHGEDNVWIADALVEIMVG